MDVKTRRSPVDAAKPALEVTPGREPLVAHLPHAEGNAFTWEAVPLPPGGGVRS